MERDSISNRAPFSANELISSRSSVKVIYSCPRPMVYFPLDTPSYSSSPASETHCVHFRVILECWTHPSTHSIGKVDVYSQDADILGSEEVLLKRGHSHVEGEVQRQMSVGEESVRLITRFACF